MVNARGWTLCEVAHQIPSSTRECFLLLSIPTFDAAFESLSITKVIKAFGVDQSNGPAAASVAAIYSVVMLAHPGGDFVMSSRASINAVIGTSEHIGPTAHQTSATEEASSFEGRKLAATSG